MIYTCYEMVRDCRAGSSEGWAYFIAHYVPVIRKALAQYVPERASDPVLLKQILEAVRKPESFIFHSTEQPEERWFVSQLRQMIVVELAAPAADLAIDLEILSAALEPFTMTERQAAWLETMRYTPAQAGPMLRVSPETIETVRARAAELLRGKVDAWRRTLLADNGPALGREAAAITTEDCTPAKAFLDVVDGRTTWRGRQDMDRHLRTCWHCIDHFCRILESVYLLRDTPELTDAECEPFRKLFGIAPPQKSGWKRLIGRA